MVKVLFVCMGNICRSPAGEAIFSAYLEEEGLADHVVCKSAGTLGDHAGERPDPRMLRAGKKRGFEFTSRARKFKPEDFVAYDFILAMDRSVYQTLHGIAKSDEERARLSIMGTFHPDPEVEEIPDPYYGEMAGFEMVLDLLEEACRGLLQEVVRKHDLRA